MDSDLLQNRGANYMFGVRVLVCLGSRGSLASCSEYRELPARVAWISPHHLPFVAKLSPRQTFHSSSTPYQSKKEKYDS